MKEQLSKDYEYLYNKVKEGFVFFGVIDWNEYMGNEEYVLFKHPVKIMLNKDKIECYPRGFTYHSIKEVVGIDKPDLMGLTFEFYCKQSNLRYFNIPLKNEDI